MTNIKPTQVLIVDDSPVSRQLLTYILESDPEIKVMGTAENGEEALNILKRQNPDIILMDIIMPRMDGLETTRKIMQTKPIPIIIVSGVYNPHDIQKSYDAISAGAVAVLEKPTGIRDPHYPEMARSITQAIKGLKEIKLKPLASLTPKEPSPSIFAKPVASVSHHSPFNLIGIGASMGGPQALNTILSDLPASFPVPILVVQQIAAGFTEGLASWLQRNSRLHIKMAQEGEIASPGHVYIAPDNVHLEVGMNHVLQLIDGPPEHGNKPSLGRLFRSMAKTQGAKSIAVVLTGRGRDGVDDLLFLKEKGALTLAQDEESSVLFDRASKAIQLNAVKQVLPLQLIASTLKSLVRST
jgi:two-component system, chemotaxis family, protein-glutamate methylesterase/glutaminase